MPCVVLDTNVVVSGDKRHLLPLREFRGIRIITPRQFLSVSRVS